MNIGIISYLTACAAFLVLAVLLYRNWREQQTGFLITLASFASILWAGATALYIGYGFPPESIILLAELLRDGGWLYFLLRMLGANKQNAWHGSSGLKWSLLASITLALAVLMIVMIPFLSRNVPLSLSAGSDVVILPWLILSITGLVFVEQVYRNCTPDERWHIKHICIGLGGLFVYDFYMYADALLLQRLNLRVWEARGLVNALVVPLIAVSAVRNPEWALNVSVSRRVIFHSSTLIGAGVYLLAMAGAGYYIRYFGGTWGAVLQIAFLFGGLLLLLALLFSGQLRSYFRVLLSKHFFPLKYDYREEWLRFTRTLIERESSLPEAVLRALSAIVDSPGGMLWVKRDNTVFDLVAIRNLPEPEVRCEPVDGSLATFLQSSGWLADLDEVETEPEDYQGLVLPEWLKKIPDAWLVSPLFSREELCAFVVLAHPISKRQINWEDRDLLKTAGCQAASQILQEKADQALMQARQFEAFNRLSAYVVHDLKNILAQQSLIVASAEKHKHNPDFIDDVVTAVHSSEARMRRLLEQLKTGMRGEQRAPLSVDCLLEEIIVLRARQQPVPVVERLDSDVLVEADRDRLKTVFGHIIQNAQEATRADGSVIIRLYSQQDMVLVEVEDNGVGMTPEFIRERLFRPFDSTKGLTGMGVGAFESREMVRALGGDIRVDSTPGAGTIFRISLPVRKQTDAGDSMANTGVEN